MSDIKYGWKCPQCNGVYAPWQGSCPPCSAPKPTTATTGGTFVGYSGTITMSPGYDWAGFGTVFIGPAVKSEAVQARETVDNWKAKGFSAKALVAAAMNTLVDGDEEDEDDEEYDD